MSALPQSDPASQRPQFGRYTLCKRIGVGGMGEIFLGVAHGAEGFEKQVVIKRILNNLAENNQFVRMFINEAKLTAKLTHSNIVQIHEFGSLDGQLYLTMEYVAGRDLAQTLRRAHERQQPVPMELAAYVISCICNGLHYAHSSVDMDGHPLELIHRDISPSNVLLSWNGEVKLADFGIAKATVTDETRTGMRKGKICYMSPEQLVGRVEQRSDLYSAGVVLWEMVAGQPLFSRMNEAQVMRCIATGALPRASDVVSIPPALQILLDRALAHSPKERFQSADEMSDALTTFILSSGRKAGPRELAAYLRRVFREDPTCAGLSTSPENSIEGRIIQISELPGERGDFTRQVLLEDAAQQRVQVLCSRRENRESFEFLEGCVAGGHLSVSELARPGTSSEGGNIFMTTAGSLLRWRPPVEPGLPGVEGKPRGEAPSMVETLVAAAGGVVERRAHQEAFAKLQTRAIRPGVGEHEGDGPATPAPEDDGQRTALVDRPYVPYDTIEVQMGYLEVESTLDATVRIDDVETDLKTPLLGENRLILSAGPHKVSFAYQELRRVVAIEIKPKVTLHLNLKLRQ